MKSTSLNTTVINVTADIVNRSKESRANYLALMAQSHLDRPQRSQMGCTNLAHVQAASSEHEKLILKDTHHGHNFAIITAYNDMLSAHQPYYRYPELLKEFFYPLGVSAQVASGVPAMCDGVTQGQLGMELSLFSRDVIAMSTAVGLSHQAFDGIVLLGVCDKIVPGLLLGALRFGYLPGIFIPSGPMPSGISNADKAKVRQDHAQGKASEKELLNSETQAYHTVGTCTFYGTANSNQMLLEAMGLMLPGSAFVPPNTSSRNDFTQLACQSLVDCANKSSQLSLANIVNEKCIVNALVVLLATGGSTNLTIHWVAVAKAAGIIITWQDIQNLSAVVPLLCKVYPNGPADINQFHEAGGTAWIFHQLLSHGLMHSDILTVTGSAFNDYGKASQVRDKKLVLNNARNINGDILASVEKPFDVTGGIKVLNGNLGKAIVKVSAVPKEFRCIIAPAKVFTSQQDVQDAYQTEMLNCDHVLVLKGQGPKANGMPELHKLMPVLANLQDAGFKVALLTDGRLSGASGKVLSAIHLVPEAADFGGIAKIKDGDIIDIDSNNASLKVLNIDLNTRTAQFDKHKNMGIGSELFSVFRTHVTPADQGAISINWDE